MRAIGGAIGVGLLFFGLAELVNAAPAVKDGPFGIYMGEPLSALRPVAPDDPSNPNGNYRVLHPPKPNPSFPIVAVAAAAPTGVCRIVGVGSRIDDDPSGAKVRAEVDRLAEVLKVKYGPYEKIDDCADADDEACGEGWAQSKLEGSVRYGYIWRKPVGGPVLGILSIGLVASSYSADSTHIGIGYDSADPACTSAEGAGL